MGQQFQPDDRGPQRDYSDLGHTEVVGDRRSVCGKVVGRLARKDADVQRHRRAGVHRDHLRNVEDAAGGDAEVALDQVKPGDDFLHPPGKQVIPNLLPSLQVSIVAPLQRTP
jgi:hypothetical protein